ncbi:MAG: hypothetical protein U0324_39385 [Polyangiales bacterium]
MAPAPALGAGVTPDPSPPVVRACAALARATRDRIARFARVGGRQAASLAERFTQFGRCIPSPRGAWALRIESFAAHLDRERRPPLDPVWVWRATWRLVYVAPDGRLVAAPGAAHDAEGFLGVERSVDPLAAYDHDGDGVSEVLLRERYDAYSEDHERSYASLTFRGGAVEAFAAPLERIESVTDADGDGRPDLVLRSSYDLSSPCGYMGALYPGPAELAHARPDGTFALDDAVAVEFARRGCPPAAETLLQRRDAPAGVDEPATGVAIACASLRGAPPEALAARVRAEFERLPAALRGEDSCMPLENLLRATETARPFAMPDRCAADGR